MKTTIADCITNATTLIQGQLDAGETTQENLDKLNKSLDLTNEEFFKYQELKSLAVNQRLTLDDANHIYRLLGGAPSVFNQQPLPVKVVLTEVFRHLLTARVNGVL